MLGAGLVFTLGWYALHRARRGPLVRTFALSDVAPAASSTTALALLAYNIAHGRGDGPDNFDGEDRATRRARLDRLAQAVSGFDVVALDEVDFDATWSHRVDQAAHLARAAGYPYVAAQANFDFAFPGFSYRFGNALLSRTPLEGCRLVGYPARSRLEAALLGHKQGLRCTTTAKGATFDVVAVHLEHRDEPTRARSVQVLLQDMPRPTVLAGDFNSAARGTPGAQPLADGRTAVDLLLEDPRLRPVGGGPRAPPTFPSWAPARRIDWIFVPRAWRVGRAEVRSTALSDHAAVAAYVWPTVNAD